MNRLQLQTAILAWLHRASLRTPVADYDAVSAFVALAQEEIMVRLRARCMVGRAVQQIKTQYLTLPDDFIEADDGGVRIPGLGELFPQTRSFLAEGEVAQLRNGYGLGATPNRPTYFSVVGREIELSPYPTDPTTAPSDWVLEMAYYRRESLGPNDADTTPSLTAWPSIWLFSSLVQSAPFIRDDARISVWGEMAQAGIDKANAEYEKAKQSGGRLIQRYRSVGDAQGVGATW